MFSVRIVTLNHYQSDPIPDLDVIYSEFRGSEVKQVPVIRVFGSTPSGQKTCLHVHGVFPYIYIPYDGSQPLDRHMQQVASSLDTALHVAQGRASSNVQHVFKVSLVSGIPMYGYHKSERQFLKIYFYNPAIKKRAVELLQNGAVMNKIFQPHESHVPFNLQFLIDYNLYGMNLLNLAAVKFRRSGDSDSAIQKPSSQGPSTSTGAPNPLESPAPLRRRHSSSGSLSVCSQYWREEDIPPSQWLGDGVARQSSCELEVDGVAVDILNRMDLQDNAETNPGLVGIWEDERQRRQQLNQMDQLLPPSSPDRGKIPLFSAEENWMSRLQEIINKQMKELQDMESQVLGSEEEPMDTQSSEDIAASASPRDSVPCTPANEVEYHYSQNPDSEPSQRQSLSGDVAPVVNEELVHSILEASQRLSQSQAQDTCDDELANLLVDLVQEDEEEEDLVVSGRRSTQGSRRRSRPGGIDISDSEDEDSPKLEAQEELEMSQAWLEEGDEWEEGGGGGGGGGGAARGKAARLNGKRKQAEENSNEEPLDHLLRGIQDQSQSSQEEQEEEEDDYIPQLDGSSDPKPKEDKKESKPVAPVGCGRLGAKSPKKQATTESAERPLAAQKIARSPLKSVDGPLKHIGDIVSLMNGSPSKDDFQDETSKKRSSRQSKTPRRQKSNSHEDESPVFVKTKKVSRSGTNSQTSKRSAKGSSRNKGKTKKTAGKQIDKADRPLVSLGKGRLGIKSPKAKDCDSMESPFFTKKMARSPKKVLNGPLEKYSGAIEYSMAPRFQYAEALKPKKNPFPYPINNAPKAVDTKRRNSSKSSSTGERTKPKQANSVKESSTPSKSTSEPSRRRRNSSRSEDGAAPSNTRRRNPSAKESNSQLQSMDVSPARVTRHHSETPQRKQGLQPRQETVRESPRSQSRDVSPARVTRHNSETPQRKQGLPSRQEVVRESPRSQSSRGTPSASPLCGMSPDEDFKESRSPRRSSQNQRPNARRRIQTGKATRKMAKGKRVKKSYQDSSVNDAKEDGSLQEVVPKTPGSNGSGRGGSKSPRRAQPHDDKPFVSDNIIRSPNKPMQGPIAVYSEAIGYKIAPMFQFAESVKPKAKVILTPLEMHIPSKSPRGMKRSSSTSVRVTETPAQSPATISRSKSVSAEDSPMKPMNRRESPANTPRNTKQSGIRMSSRSPLKTPEKSASDGSVKDELKSTKPKRNVKRQIVVLDSDVEDTEESLSPVLEKSFVFGGSPSSHATIGRGHMGSRSPKDLAKMETCSSSLVNSKNIARSPLKEVKGPLGKTQKSVSKHKGNTDKQTSKKKKDKSALSKEDQASGSHQEGKKKTGGKNAGKEIQNKKNEGAKTNGTQKKMGPKSSLKDGKGKKDQQQKGSKSNDQPVKKARKPVPLKFDPLTMRSLRIRERTIERVKLCKSLTPQLVLRKLCLDEMSWSEVVRNALYRDLDRQAKRKRKEEECDTEFLDPKRMRRGITPPWRKGPPNSSPRKEKLKAIMAAKEGKDIYKRLKGSKPKRRSKKKMKDEFGGGPDNKSWNYVPPIAVPREHISMNPIPEISEPGKDDSRDVMWRLACYSPPRPDAVSSPPRCWSPVGSISETDEEEENDEDEETEDEDVVAEQRKDENAAPVPISDNEMDIIERNLGQISDFSVYEKMLGGVPVSKANQPEQKANDGFALEHFQDDVSGIDNHLHGNPDKDDIAHEFAMLDKTVFSTDGTVQLARFGKENVVPHRGRPGNEIKQAWEESVKQTTVGSQPPAQGANQKMQQSQSYQNHAPHTPTQVTSAIIPQQIVSQGTSHSLNNNSQGSNSTRSSSQITPGQKAPSYQHEGSNSGSATYSPHSQPFSGSSGNSGTSSSQYGSQSQRVGHQAQGPSDPTTIPETDSEHSSTGSPAQTQYSTHHANANQHNHQKEPDVNSQTSNSMYYHSNLHASQSMYDMSNHSFSQSGAYGESRQPNPNQSYNQSHLPPFPSPSPHPPQGYPPPYPSPQPSYNNHQHTPPSHQHQSQGHTQPQTQPYGVPYPHSQHTYPDSNNANSAAKPKIWRPVAMPPTDSVVRSSLPEFGLPEVHHQGAYWGNPQDHTGRSREGLGQSSVQSMLPSALQQADTPCGTVGLSHWQTVVQSQNGSSSSQNYSNLHHGYNRDSVWMPSKYPPPRGNVSNWLNNKQQNGQMQGYGHGSRPLQPFQQVQQPQGQQIVAPPVQSPGRGMPLMPPGHARSPSPHHVSPHGQSGVATMQNFPKDVGRNGMSGSNRQPHPQQVGAQARLPPPMQPPPHPLEQPLMPTQQGATHNRPTPVQTHNRTPSSVRYHGTSSQNTPSARTVEHAASPAPVTSPGISTPTGNRFPSQCSKNSPLCTPSSGIPKGAEGCTPPLSSTPLRPLTRTSALAEQQPGVTPITAPKPNLMRDLNKAKAPLTPITPAQLFSETPLQRKRSLTSQLEGPTPKNPYGFKVSQGNMQDAKALHEVQHLTTMSLEIHARTRRDYNPDPDFDPIRAIFYCIHTDNPHSNLSSHAPSNSQTDEDSDGRSQVGMIVVDLSPKQGQRSHDDTVGGNMVDSNASTQRDWLARSGVTGLKVTYVKDEKQMFEEFIKLVKKHDPDILAGFEIQQLSWGYLFQRAAFLEVQLCKEISRLPECERDSHFSADKDAYGADHMSEITVAGRIMLNLWRIIKHEVTLNIYTFENVAYHVLHQRLPNFTFRTLTDWFDHITACYRWRTIEYYTARVRGNMRFIKQLDLIGRTSELARLFGIEFYSVLSRGSQYRVESMMLRQAKVANFIALSPSVQQRARSKAPECIPLVMEPESRFYEDPVIVLDFQSLYPSMMIAYNYCFSTCLGRVEHIAQGGEYKLGCHSLSVPPGQLTHLLESDGVHVAPNGVAFVKHGVRHGVLPRMLDQILNTRIMVKKALKDHKGDKILGRMLDNRQLGLKLIANVTYGYTSANFSGRMPCIEVGDSVVRKGRETLERAIRMVETTPKWGARVVYGDTDSMFVLVKGVTQARAFEIGREIVDAVTAENPKPVKLKLEKVYKPCVLQAKKRYVGYKYESPDQTQPEFEAKGIETVRRDSCPAVAKILERSLKTLFETQDVSKVKQYVQQQFQKLNWGHIGLQDLIFAKEYRGRQYYKAGACVPALEIAKRKLAVDRRSEPRVSERVPYVVVHGSPGLPLIQLVRTPQEYLRDPALHLNAPYYITRQIIPALNRVLGIMGVDALEWYQALPRGMFVSTVPSRVKATGNTKKGTISQYFCSLNCAVCDRLTQSGLCEVCRSNPQATVTSLMRRVQEWDRSREQINKICSSCCGFGDSKQHCVSLDCPIRFQLAKTEQRMDKVEHFISLVQSTNTDGS